MRERGRGGGGHLQAHLPLHSQRGAVSSPAAGAGQRPGGGGEFIADLRRSHSSRNTWMSTLKLSLVGHSADWVASSHFSNSRANRGKRGCLVGGGISILSPNQLPLSYL